MSRLPLVRFAPSPNGYLHLGHALSALVCAQWAEALGGRLLLRIEDTDLSRARPQFVEAIHGDLAWLGLQFEADVRVQSQHLPRYEAALRALYDRGLVYPAPASRAEIAEAVGRLHDEGIDWPRDPDGSPHYPFAARDRADRPAKLPDSVPIRLDMAGALQLLGVQQVREKYLDQPTGPLKTRTSDPSVWGDVLLRGRDRPATYHWAVVLDDADQQISHVVRGRDLEPATSLHRLLQELMGLPGPIYHHHRLVLGEDGKKLSKSDGAKSLRALRRGGLDPATLRSRLLVFAAA